MSSTTAPSPAAPATPTNGAVPPGLKRAYSFTDHSTYQPSVPAPGDKLDGEFDNIYRMLVTMHEFCTSLMRPVPITRDMLDPKLFTVLDAHARTAVQPDLDRMQATLAYTIGAADRAAKEATRAQQALIQMQVLARAVEERADDDDTARADILALERTAEDAATDAANSANDAALAANHAQLDQELAGAWAEYLEGNSPIPDMFFAHTSITGQHWSSRWWAIKAAGAFGAMSELYLGALPTPPTTDATGGPIPTGAIYYNTTTELVYVWDGTEWKAITQPGKGIVASLVYRATADQAIFDTTLNDITGAAYAMPTGCQVEVFVNGVRAVPDVPPGEGDYLSNDATSTVTFSSGLLAGTMVQIDILIPPEALAPGSVTTQALLDFDINPTTGSPGEIDGTKTTFALALASDHSLITVSRAAELMVVLDGSPQQPDVDFSVSGSAITFSEAPAIGSRAWGMWFSPDSVGAMARISATLRNGSMINMGGAA